VCSKMYDCTQTITLVTAKALITSLCDRWTVKIKGGPDLDVQGDILDHEYTLGEGREKVAEVAKNRRRLC